VPGPASAVPPVLTELVDDASIFPPADLSMSDAVAAHRAHKLGPHADLVGRFVCPSSRITELRAVLDVGSDPHHPLAGAGPVRVAVIADTGVERLPRAMADVAADPRLVLEAVEVPLPAGLAGRSALAEATHRVLAGIPTALLAYVELPSIDGWETTLDVLATAGRGAKLRTGGLTAAAFPTEVQVAAVLAACAARQVPLKFTAGLHHAIRHRDPVTGFEHHGFLNVLLAAAAARDESDAVAVLSEQDGLVLATATRALDPAVRKLFVSFGSCSLTDPIDDLVELGLL
jgi:hypothetical protein